MANENMAPDQMGQRVKKLEDAVRNANLEICKLQTSVEMVRADAAKFKEEFTAAQHLLERLKDVPNQTEALEKRITALETEIKTLPDLIKKEATQARTSAETTAQGFVDALSADGGALFNLNKEHDNLSMIVDEIKHPKSAVEIAAVRLPLYRNFLLDELKDALSQDSPEVLVEIASRLAPQNAKDSEVLTNMFTFVKKEHMAELVTFAGSKAE